MLLLARYNIYNRYGINAGNNVSLTAQRGAIYGGGYIKTRGDISQRAYSYINTGALTGRNISLASSRGYLSLNQRIAASGDVSLYAYRNITNRNGITAGKNLSIYSQYGSINNPGWAWARRNINARAYYNIDSRYLAGSGNTTFDCPVWINNQSRLSRRSLIFRFMPVTTSITIPNEHAAYMAPMA